MPLASMGGGSIGAAIGKAAAKATKPKSKGAAVGKAVARTVKPRRTSSSSSRSSGSSSSSRSRSSSSGGSSRSSGGGGGGGSSSAARRVVASVPSIASYLGTDSAYQGVVRGGKRSLADFLSELGRRRGEATTQFNTTKASMERDRVQQLEALRNEFASRGLIQSGLYADEQGRFQQQFTEQMNALGQQQTSLLADLLSQEKNYRREQELSLEAARQEALQRRAARFNVGG